MTGIEFHRRRRRLTRSQLAELAGVHFNTVYRMELGLRSTSLALTLARLARALDVPMRELGREYDESALRPGDHSTYPLEHEQEHLNCLEAYRKANNYNFRELGELLGTSRQWAHKECREREQPHASQLRKLAVVEGVSVEDFCARWCPANHCCSCKYQQSQA